NLAYCEISILPSKTMRRLLSSVSGKILLIALALLILAQLSSQLPDGLTISLEKLGLKPTHEDSSKLRQQ
ncbi:MAG: hypothetical protein ABGZ19_05795, partial [Verrucomicrobiales bacterium]